MAIKKEIFMQLVGFVVQTPQASRDDVVNYFATIPGYTLDGANQWVDAFIAAMHEALALDEPTFEELLAKVLKLHADDLNKVIEIVEAYIRRHPLRFVVEAQIAEKEAELASIGPEPDDKELIETGKEFHPHYEMKRELEDEINRLKSMVV